MCRFVDHFNMLICTGLFKHLYMISCLNVYKCKGCIYPIINELTFPFADLILCTYIWYEFSLTPTVKLDFILYKSKLKKSGRKFIHYTYILRITFYATEKWMNYQKTSISFSVNQRGYIWLCVDLLSAFNSVNK